MTHTDDILTPLNQIFMQLGQNLSLGNLSLDDNGALTLVFDDQLVVEVQTAIETKTLFLISPLSAMPEDEGTGFYKRLLEAPLIEGALAGAFFCLDQESNEILLLRARPIEGLSLEDIEHELERFVNTLEHFAKKTKNGILSLNAPDTNPSDALHDAAVRI